MTGVYAEHVLPFTNMPEDLLDEQIGIEIAAAERRAERERKMGEYAEDLLARQHPEVFGSGYGGRRRGARPSWPAKGLTPRRPGLDPAEWDYENPGDCLWVTKEGDAVRLADMKTSHLVNTWRFLVRGNSEELLLITPMGRAFVAEQRRRGVLS